MRNIVIKLVVLFAIVLFVIFADQYTKQLVVSQIPLDEGISLWKQFFMLFYVRNYGGAFSIFQNAKYLFLTTGILIPIIISWFFRKKILESYLFTTSISMIVGGAIGNLIDRFRFGYVIDFIKVGTFPVFNVADSFITVGVIFLAILLYIEESKANCDRSNSGA